MILSQVAGAAGDLRETNVRTYYFTHRASCSYRLGVAAS